MDWAEVINRINALVRAKGVSKMQFYKDCEITGSAMSQWKTGLTQPRHATLAKIAEYLGVTVKYLLNGDDELRAAFYGDADLTEEERALLWTDVRDYYEFRKSQILKGRK